MKSNLYIRQLEDTISRITTERDDALFERDTALKRAHELEKENMEIKKKFAYFVNSTWISKDSVTMNK